MPGADLYIVAAGNGSRFNAELPKALVPITNEPCLTTTLKQIAGKFNRVYVITNVLAQAPWRDYFRSLRGVLPEFEQLIVNLPIASGLGDGHATLQGLLAAEAAGHWELARDAVIAWGDVFFPHSEIIDELLSSSCRGAGLFPAVQENKPYVSLQVNEKMQCIAAHFSKYGEQQLVGLHDQSVFRFERASLKATLTALHNALWKGGRYITPGGELSLLYSVHQFYNSGEPVEAYETRYPTLSFNTIEEVVEIQQEINIRWHIERQIERRAGAVT